MPEQLIWVTLPLRLLQVRLQWSTKNVKKVFTFRPYGLVKSQNVAKTFIKLFLNLWSKPYASRILKRETRCLYSVFFKNSAGICSPDKMTNKILFCNIFFFCLFHVFRILNQNFVSESDSNGIPLLIPGVLLINLL